MNLTIPELPGLTGVWRLNTGSENAAVETAAAGDMMVLAREGGAYLPAILYFQWRYRAEDGSPYPVPALQIGLSLEQVAKGQLPAGPAGLVAQLRGGTAGPQAIAAGQPPAPAIEAPPAAGGEDPGLTAQYYADLAADAADRADIEALIKEAESDGVDGHMVRVDDVVGQLRSYLRACWQKLPASQGGGGAE